MTTSDKYLPVIHLHPGEVHFGARGVLVHTVLGSCVALTFFAPVQRLAAICHVLLPSGADYEDGSTFRYLETAVPYLLSRFSRRGLHASALEIKLFGGGDVLQPRDSATRATVGAQNIAAAHRLLGDAGIVLAGEDVGGTCARTLYFNTETGEVLLRRVSAESAPCARLPRVRRLVAPGGGLR